MMVSRTDIIGSNGNDGQHYLVEQVCRIIAGDGADQTLGGKMRGCKAWQQHVKQAIEIIQAVRDFDK